MSSPKKSSATSSSRHRLAAILFCDIKGYTSLMEDHEQKALDYLHKFKTALEKFVDHHHGEIIQFYGDGCLAIFDSSVDAVDCARNLQIDFHQKTKIPVRIGIHTGDVVIRDENVFGDAVNIASRIESMAIPGSVLLSGNVRNHIKNKPNFQLIALGQFDLKNVSEAISIYALNDDQLVIPKQSDFKTTGPKPVRFKFNRLLFFLIPMLILVAAYAIYAWSSNDKESRSEIVQTKPSIVVLPFDNLSNDPNQANFADAFADEIRISLSSIKRLKVISRSSSMYFKGKDVTMEEIAQTLGIEHVLSGSVLRFGDKLKINIELSHAASDEIMWTLKTEQRSLDEIFDIQQEIAMEVAKQMRIQLNEREIANSFRAINVDPNIYEEVLKINNNLSDYYPDNFNLLHTDLQTILEQEPNYVPAIKLRALAFIYEGLGPLAMDSVRKYVPSLLTIAERLDPQNRVLPAVTAMYKLWYEWDFLAAEKFLKLGLDIFDEESGNILIELYQKIGNFKQAQDVIKLLDEVNPIFGHNHVNKIRNIFFSGDIEKAKKEAQDYFANNQVDRNTAFDLGRIYLTLDQNQEAVDHYEFAMKQIGEFTPYLAGYLPIAYHRLERMNEFDEVIEQLESQYLANQESSPAYFLAAVYCNIGETEKGFEWLEKSYAARDVELTWLKSDPIFNPVKSDPRYLDMLDRVGFPKRLLN